VDLSISGTDIVEGRRRNTKKRRKKKQSGRRPVDGPETWDFPAEANAKCRFGWVCFS